MRFPGKLEIVKHFCTFEEILKLWEKLTTGPF
jgi:hypothetical protein